MKKEDMLTAASLLIAGVSSYGIYSLIGPTPTGFIIFLTVAIFLCSSLILNHRILAKKENFALHITIWLLLAGANALTGRSYLGTPGVYIGVGITVVIFMLLIVFNSKKVTTKTQTPHSELTETTDTTKGKEGIRSTLRIDDPEDPDKKGLVDTTDLFHQSQTRSLADQSIAEARMLDAQNQRQQAQLALVEQIRTSVRRGEMEEIDGNRRIKQILKELAPLDDDESDDSKQTESKKSKRKNTNNKDHEDSWISFRQKQKRK